MGGGQSLRREPVLRHGLLDGLEFAELLQVGDQGDHLPVRGDLRRRPPGGPRAMAAAWAPGLREDLGVRHRADRARPASRWTAIFRGRVDRSRRVGQQPGEVRHVRAGGDRAGILEVAQVPDVRDTCRRPAPGPGPCASSPTGTDGRRSIRPAANSRRSAARRARGSGSSGNGRGSSPSLHVKVAAGQLERGVGDLPAVLDVRGLVRHHGRDDLDQAAGDHRDQGEER